MYCIFTIGLPIFYQHQLTTIRTAYLLSEVTIIYVLVSKEHNVANEINKKE
jgi:hypothetical protein